MTKLRAVLKNDANAADCKLGLVNGSRNCGACDERRGCAFAIKRKTPQDEGRMKFPSMSYPVQEKRMEPAPFSGTTGFC